ncbi:uncharacterized protein ACR2FA_003639 [Aphomia sociella]
MEEDASAKVPVTRLRRRLSVELTEDSRSPSAPSTPTKKRGGRLATKPQLELIDENASDNAPKRGAKKITPKDIIEEEKPVTPSRRSARIKSNTSIVADTPQACDSPRAKRAARRTSQIGSDNETSLTPARQTRRTRKDSTSSIEKLDTVGNNKAIPVTEPIVEEKEVNKNNSTDEIDSDKNKPLRKSPRSKSRSNRNSLNDNEADNKQNELEKEEIKQSSELDKLPIVSDITLQTEFKSKDNDNQENKILLNHKSPIEKNKKRNSLNKSADFSVDIQLNSDNKNDQTSAISSNKENEKIKLSESNADLIDKLDSEPKKVLSNINKSTSSVEDVNNLKNKRHRTKSWTNSSNTPLIHDYSNFYSDSERKNKKKDKQTNNSFKVLNLSDKSNSHVDHILNITEQEYSSMKEINVKTNQHDKKEVSIDPDSSDNLFKKGPASVIQSIIYFDDSDTDSKKSNHNKQSSDNEDQCVPVINNNFELDNISQEKVNKNIDQETDEKQSSFSNKINEKPAFNTSCEPMDIDESIPNNISIINTSNKSQNISIINTSNKSQTKNSDECNSQASQEVKNFNNSINTPKRTSKSFSKSNSLDKIENENKSTLILSQLKDVSATENNMTKSPKPSKNEIVSNSFNNLEAEDKKKNKKNISLDYSTSTPLQQKSLKKMAMQINTSVINNSNTELKTDTSNHRGTPKKEISVVTNKSQTLDSTQRESDSEEDSDTEEESDSHVKKSMLYDEAEEASDDYESGDSRNEDEREYEKENEILEKGETLESDEEITDDTDYEKDSFVVSSDEEDYDLLDGSGDDLSVSDNELTMSKKSKKKYNERKIKEQKKASREMFEARHNISNNSAKSEDPKSKKRNRQRLDSSNLNSDEEIVTDVKKTKRLSKSISNISTNKEAEITINNESVIEKDDPLSILVKPEPKTPLKDLNMSTVPITENIEEVEIGDNFSILKSNNETSDPLKNAEFSDNDSSLSGNEEIMKKFDSVLEDLNNVKDKKLKLTDTSLNLNGKNKKKSNEPIVDQLNLTETKKTKKNKKVEAAAVTNPKEKIMEQISHKDDFNDDDSSNSIDLQLLFSEDSMESVNKNTENKISKINKSEEFIPLNKSQGKVNIPNDKSVTAEHNSSLSKDKAKKRKSSLSSTSNVQTEDNLEGVQEFPMFIDTIGSGEATNTSACNSLNTSSRKKKNSLSITDSGQIVTEGTRENKKDVSVTEAKDKSFNMSLNTSAKKKKNRKSSLNTFEQDANEEKNKSSLDNVGATNISLNTSTKKNNKKQNLSILNNSQHAAIEDHSQLEQDACVNLSLTSSKKKNKKKHNASTTNDSTHNIVEDTASDAPTEVPFESHKIVQNADGVEIAIDTRITREDDTLNSSLNSSLKKKKNRKSLPEDKLNNSIGSSKNKEKMRIDTEIPKATKDITVPDSKDEEIESSKKRKRKLSSTNHDEDVLIGLNTLGTSDILNESLTKNQKKKRKISHKEDTNDEIKGTVQTNKQTILPIISKETDTTSKSANKKRKERDDDEVNKTSKILKKNSLDKISVPRLPSTILNQLDDKPKKEILEKKKSKIVSTTQFKVEDIMKRRNKPSNYLEESVYLNDTHEEKKQRGNIKIPKVLPFVPTASTSGNGFTTKFQINVVPKETKFIAQTANISGFKSEYLYGKKIKRLGTYEMYKKQRNVKMAKF